MAPPFVIRVLGEDWEVEVEPILYQTDGTRAYCDYEARKIVLDPHRSGREDLLHELIHSVGACLNMEFSEEQVQSTARGLWAICRDNREIMRDYLFGANSDQEA